MQTRFCTFLYRFHAGTFVGKSKLYRANNFMYPITLADLGGVPGARPLWDPILSFLHTFSLKSAHIGGPCPP